MKSINILFVHPLEGNAYELFKAFKRNKKVNIIPLIKAAKCTKTSLLNKIRHKFKVPEDIYNINKLLTQMDLSQFDIIFVVKSNELRVKTLKVIKNKFPHLKLINWSLDDMYAWHNRSIFYTFGIKYYDLIVTTKSYNVKELKKLGAQTVLYTNQAYSIDIHKPEKNCTEENSHDVLFIGYPEKERIESIIYLAQHGIKIDIYGYPEAWSKVLQSDLYSNIRIHKKNVYAMEYARLISCSKISLNFLRKINRDLHTSRSVEIPACKGFMISERTSEHANLFEEDKEAVYFSNNEELLEKVHYYLKHKEERKKIAQSGLDRCLSSAYSYDDMIKRILNGITL